ncbi:hypothetical protein CMUS01_12269 [Colletotrichum musicola]|uniref:Yeast cell wall synthesis Kre9/Knh1-like N-terminal domain-containing protein n=1 Tax=Colletotrichum musicola TaxID=2175873 RepID=A0A8H6N139_9PEZI|nr:hypothetical protein CMUS01_12269 [Colletotrichum musicola]
MRFFTVAAALAAPLLVSAIEFTSPSLNSTVTKGSKFELSWDTVDTDPSAFSVYLVNFVNWPPSYTLLAQDIETSAGAVSVQVPCSVDSSAGYQFNAINGTNVYVIYAQTPKFSIGGSDCTDPTPLPPAGPSTCAPPATVTVTVSKTLSRNSTATATGGHTAKTQHQITASPVRPSVKTIITTVFQGTCPDTIGWSSGYNHPVTLTKPPRAPPGPVVTKAPHGSVVEEDDDEEENVTSTIYRTTYLPLEMAPTACTC